MRPHKFERIRFPVRLDELVDIPIRHPFRYHCELVFIRRNAQKWQHVRMAKSVPCHDLLAEHLHKSVSADRRNFLTRPCRLTLVILPISLVE